MYDHEYKEESIRLVHPLTGAFICELHPVGLLLVSTKNKKTAIVRLLDVLDKWESLYARKEKTISDD
jgi:hypothetical protein